MCTEGCDAFVCAECVKAQAYAAIFKERCASLETQLEEWKRRGMESDARAVRAEAALERFVGAVAKAERDGEALDEVKA